MTRSALVLRKEERSRWTRERREGQRNCWKAGSTSFLDRAETPQCPAWAFVYDNMAIGRPYSTRTFRVRAGVRFHHWPSDESDLVGCSACRVQRMSRSNQ